jgi:hypothetical protein
MINAQVAREIYEAKEKEYKESYLEKNKEKLDSFMKFLDAEIRKAAESRKPYIEIYVESFAFGKANV